MPSWFWVRIEPRSSHTEGVCATNALLHIHLLVTNKTLKYKLKAIKMIHIKLERKLKKKSFKFELWLDDCLWGPTAARGLKKCVNAAWQQLKVWDRCFRQWIIKSKSSIGLFILSLFLFVSLSLSLSFVALRFLSLPLSLRTCALVEFCVVLLAYF